MIHIDRNRLDPRGNPVRPADSWFARARAATSQAITDGAGHEVVEAVYRDPSVKIALEELFHRKCAYCESPLSEVGWHVEHFRPKNRVAERPDHPGYYWLAYEWSNLYPSCAPCNQNLEDKPSWEDPTPGETAGKRDKFPLEFEADRILYPNGNLSVERPLLLDPCADDPEACLKYTVEGDVNPLSGDRRAEATIQILHLKRGRLRRRRKEHLEAVTLILKFLRRRRESEDPATLAEMERDVERLWFADSAPFAGAARFVRNDPDAFGI